jgi:hypothetical protein
VVQRERKRERESGIEKGIHGWPKERERDSMRLWHRNSCTERGIDR